MRSSLESVHEHHRAGRFIDAEAGCREILARHPRDVAALHLLGVLTQQSNRHAEAIDLYRQAIAIDPQHAESHLSLGFVSLLLGDYATGWREYEWRSTSTNVAIRTARHDVPRWDGSDPAGRTLFVYCEPSFTDSIQFARYLPLLHGRGADVVLACPQPLVRLFGSLPGVCVVAEGDPSPHADFSIALGSLPLMFATTVATIPTFSAYLRPDARLVATWRERLRPPRATGARLIGVAGDSQNDDNPASSTLSLSEFAPLGNGDSTRIIALTQTCASSLPQPPGMNGFSHPFHDLAGMAALIAQLDLVITADMSIAHLAGALGKPVWTFVREGVDWQWSTAGESTSWYPTMRLLRQETPGHWTDILRTVTVDLKLAAPAQRRNLAA
jgi:hypothetical protein